MIILSASKRIEIRPIGFVERTSSDDDVGDKSLVSRIILKKDFVKALDGVEEFFHVFIIYWMYKISNTERKFVYSGDRTEMPTCGGFCLQGPNSSESYRFDFGGAC